VSRYGVYKVLKRVSDTGNVNSNVNHLHQYIRAAKLVASRMANVSHEYPKSPLKLS